MNSYEFEKQYISNVILINDINKSSISQDVLGLIKRDSSLIVQFENQLTSDEEITLATIVTNHIGGDNLFYQENHHVETLSTNKLVKETWYETSNGDGTFSGKAREIVYTWSGLSVTQETESTYCTNGALWSQTTYKYYTNSDGTMSRELEV